MLERNDWRNGRSALKLHIGINICAKQAFKTLNQQDLQQIIHLHSFPELEISSQQRVTRRHWLQKSAICRPQDTQGRQTKINSHSYS